MKVHVIIPSFNDLAELKGCIYSIQQAVGGALGKTVQVTVRDAQSTDGTEAFLADLQLEGVNFVCEADSGIYDAMNKGVSDAKAEWVYFLGADDRLQAGFMAAVDALTLSNTIYYGDVTLASSGKRYDGRFSALKLVYRNICHQAIFYPRELLRQSPFCTRYVTHADWAKNIEFMASQRFEYLDRVVATYRDREGQSGTVFDAAFAEDKSGLFRQYHGKLAMLLSMTASIPTRIYHLFKGPRIPER